MNVELLRDAAKYLKRMNQPNKGRIVRGLEKLALDPPQGDITPLEGREGYRLRVGGYRVLFDIDENMIVVYNIAPRGQAYKGGF
ncbi:MAG: type II toxin-antitoxin system RelE/ParE family toxin [Oscillospiraceae bacterium]|nr:type II toxin-antitoxin system RelE/ParE family toxin [Oscillospiraceae bacterium]